MKQEIRHPDKRAHTGSYSAAVLIDGWLFISGQGRSTWPPASAPARTTVQSSLAGILVEIDAIARVP